MVNKMKSTSLLFILMTKLFTGNIIIQFRTSHAHPKFFASKRPPNSFLFSERKSDIVTSEKKGIR